ncbi:MAG: aldehyde dehydrogenase family protein, partial [Ectothiorhodospiraceae bacterium]
NYPLQLSLGPLVAALAAGNRAMIKLSEYTPHTNDALQGLLGNVFTEDRVSVVQGEAEVAAAFAALPFDHLLFTGSTPVGRKVMAAAAANLTPVTLELGGKSPAIVDASANLETAAERICFGKSMNAGQTCIAPDYVLCPVEDVGEFVAAYRRAFARMYPSLRDNPDYSTIVNDAHLERLEALIADARDRGARIEVLNPACETLADTRKLAPRLLLDTSEEMRVRNEEIFGPLLPVIAYERLGDAVAHVNRGPRPLALYWFGVDDERRRRVLESTHAGGVTVNDTLTHFVQESLPFGGIGESGMGQYHGHAGFLTFSKAKGVLRRGRFNPGRFAYPPYRPWVRRILEVLTLR